MTDETTGTGRHRGADDAVRRLSEDTALFVREEIARLRGELLESARRAGLGTAALAAAGVCGVLAMHTGSVTALRALETMFPPGRAALVLTMIYVAAGGAMTIYGLNKLRTAGLLPHGFAAAEEMVRGADYYR